MPKSLALGGLLGGFVLFIWGMVSWTVLPWHMMTLEKFTNEVAVAEVLATNATGGGVYLLPNPHKHAPGLTDEQKKAAEQDGHRRMMQGPFMLATVSPEGGRPMGQALLTELCTQIAGAILATWLLLQAGGLSYMRKVGFIMTLALLAGVIMHIPNWNWWKFSTGYMAVGFADLLIGWLLAGLVIAKIVSAR